MIDGMREGPCTISMGAPAVIATFVNQHQFFIDRDQLVTDEVTTDGESGPAGGPRFRLPGVEASPAVSCRRGQDRDAGGILHHKASVSVLRNRADQVHPARLPAVHPTADRDGLGQGDHHLDAGILRSSTPQGATSALRVEDLKTHGLTEHPGAPARLRSRRLWISRLRSSLSPTLAGNSYIEGRRRAGGDVQLPLFQYTLFSTSEGGRRPSNGFMVLHCTAGDAASLLCKGCLYGSEYRLFLTHSHPEGG